MVVKLSGVNTVCAVNLDKVGLPVQSNRKVHTGNFLFRAPLMSFLISISGGSAQLTDFRSCIRQTVQCGRLSARWLYAPHISGQWGDGMIEDENEPCPPAQSADLGAY